MSSLCSNESTHKTLFFSCSRSSFRFLSLASSSGRSLCNDSVVPRTDPLLEVDDFWCWLRLARLAFFLGALEEISILMGSHICEETKWLPFCRWYFQTFSWMKLSEFALKLLKFVPKGLIDSKFALVQMMVKSWSNHVTICTCHDSSAVVTCAKSWPDWIIIFRVRTTWFFPRFGLWAHKPVSYLHLGSHCKGLSPIHDTPLATCLKALLEGSRGHSRVAGISSKIQAIENA